MANNIPILNDNIIKKNFVELYKAKIAVPNNKRII